jgi:Tat protein secretion system quality control protein TatD with DNase activity
MPKNLKIKGRRNEPKFIVEVAKRIASLQNKSLEDISQIFFENSLKFFDL